MKKSLIALAVAGVISAPAFAATSNVDVYGVMSIAIQDTDAANSDIQVTDNVSRIGFKGSEDLGGGLKAVWQIESQLSTGSSSGAGAVGAGAVTGGAAADGVGGTQSLGGRNTFIGLAGDFGTAVIGRHDTPYKLGTGSLDIFGDTIGDYNGRTINNVRVDLVSAVHDARSSNAIAYISPTWSGFHFAVAAVATNAAANLGSNDTFDALSATGVYVNGPLFASLSFQDVNALGNSDTATKLGVGYTMGDASVGFIYESTDLVTHDSSWLINGKYNMGAIALKAQYGQVDAGATNPTKFDLGADYALSKRTSAYAVYSMVDNDANADGNGFNIGVKHSF